MQNRKSTIQIKSKSQAFRATFGLAYDSKEYLHNISPEVLVDDKDDIIKIVSKWLIE